jgi:hypothetical protein
MGWLSGRSAPAVGRPPGRPEASCGLRSTGGSTEDHQDPVTSRARQREQAAALVAGQGRIVAEFFDIGQSRTLAWPRRPQAAALIAALADPDRGWEAIVSGNTSGHFMAASTPVWRRCSTITASSCGCRRLAAGFSLAAKITSR